MKILCTICFLFVGLQAQVACKGCTVGKDMARCDYYVKIKHDLSYQDRCISYAKAIDTDGMFAKASWYYLLGGDKDSAQKSASKALKIGHHYASEYSGFVFILEHDLKNAKKELTFFKQRVKNIDYVKDDIKSLKSIYKDFDDKTAYKILFN